MSKKIGRNDLCICGSGVKLKKCCEANRNKALSVIKSCQDMIKAKLFEEMKSRELTKAEIKRDIDATGQIHTYSING